MNIKRGLTLLIKYPPKSFAKNIEEKCSDYTKVKKRHSLGSLTQHFDLVILLCMCRANMDFHKDLGYFKRKNNLGRTVYELVCLPLSRCKLMNRFKFVIWCGQFYCPWVSGDSISFAEGWRHDHELSKPDTILILTLSKWKKNVGIVQRKSC